METSDHMALLPRLLSLHMPISQGPRIASTTEMSRAFRKRFRVERIAQPLSNGCSAPSGIEQLGCDQAGDVTDGDLAITTGRSKFLVGTMLGINHHYGRSSASKRNRPSVVSWAVSFEKVLEDPSGLRTFTEFLKREFSAENINFWIACERYRYKTEKHERRKLAKEIFDRYLCHGAPEPINIDSQARQMALDGVDEAYPELFIQAQKQIFNLMKFDCYQRFLKSELFTESLTAEKLGKPLPCDAQAGSRSPAKSLRSRSKSSDRNLHIHNKSHLNYYNNNINNNNNTTENDKEEFDEKKRKSLLPWQKSKTRIQEPSGSPVLGESNSSLRKSARKKNFLKPREKKESDTSDELPADSPEDMSPTSIEGSTLDEMLSLTDESGNDTLNLCRITLPDSSTTVLKALECESVGSMVYRLMEKRGLSPMAVEVYSEDTEEVLDPRRQLTVLLCNQIRVEKRILLRLELPLKKIVAVKSIPGKTCSEVLEPVLKKYHLDMCDVILQFANCEENLNVEDPVDVADGQMILVRIKEVTEDSIPNPPSDTSQLKIPNKIRSDITSYIFESILKGRLPLPFDSHGVLDLEETFGNQADSLVPNDDDDDEATMGVTRRNSFTLNKDNKTKSRAVYSGRASIHEGMGIKIQTGDKLLQLQQQEELGQRRNSTKSVHYRDSCDLAVAWNRAQQRLDDQRGTELNCELPDFLRIKSDSSLDTPESSL